MAINTRSPFFYSHTAVDLNQVSSILEILIWKGASNPAPPLSPQYKLIKKCLNTGDKVWFEVSEWRSI